MLPQDLKGDSPIYWPVAFLGYVAQRENANSEDVYSVELLLKLTVTFGSRHLSVINMVYIMARAHVTICMHVETYI